MEIELLGGFKFFFILVVSFKFFFILVVSSKFFYFCNNRSYTRIGILNIRTCFTLKRKRFCWIKDKSLADLDNLPDPDVLATEIIDNLESAMNNFKEIISTLKG